MHTATKFIVVLAVIGAGICCALPFRRPVPSGRPAAVETDPPAAAPPGKTPKRAAVAPPLRAGDQPENAARCLIKDSQPEVDPARLPQQQRPATVKANRTSPRIEPFPGFPKSDSPPDLAQSFDPSAEPESPPEPGSERNFPRFGVRDETAGSVSSSEDPPPGEKHTANKPQSNQHRLNDPERASTAPRDEPTAGRTKTDEATKKRRPPKPDAKKNSPKHRTGKNGPLDDPAANKPAENPPRRDDAPTDKLPTATIRGITDVPRRPDETAAPAAGAIAAETAVAKTPAAADAPAASRQSRYGTSATDVSFTNEPTPFGSSRPSEAASGPEERRSDGQDGEIENTSISDTQPSEDRFANGTDDDRFARFPARRRDGAEPSPATDLTRERPQPVFTNPPATPPAIPATRPPLASMPAGPGTEGSLPSRSSGRTSQPRIVAEPPTATTAEDQEAWRMARRDPQPPAWNPRESQPGAPEPNPTNPGVQAGATRFVRHRVVDGDSLASLAEKYLGSRLRYLEIFNANRHVLASPDLLPIGIELLMPTPAATPATALPRRESSAPQNPSPAAGWGAAQPQMVPIPADVLPHLRR